MRFLASQTTGVDVRELIEGASHILIMSRKEEAAWNAEAGGIEGTANSAERVYIAGAAKNGDKKLI